MNSVYTVAKSYRALHSHLFQLWCIKYSTATVSSKGNIKIPNRIPRGPTDILKALEKTVSYDLSGPSYRFFDDPILAPYHERQERIYSLAKSAGRKAARWVRDEHPELFTQVISDPPVMSYMPPIPINGDTVSEELLFQKICDSKVTDAMKVYEVMKGKNMELSEDAKQSLLELLCFYNCEDPLPMDFEADRYYSQLEQKKDATVNNWKDEPIVKDLFTSLESLGSAPYSALLCGLYTYGAKTEGDELLKEMKDKKIMLDVHAYNAIIMRTISKYDTADAKRDMVMDTLKEMSTEGVKPNLGTLNAIMDSLSRLGFKNKFDTLLKLMAEFNKIGVKPSLGTYSLFIRGHLGRVRPDHNVLKFITPLLQSLKPEDVQIRHKADLHFFVNVMRACLMFENLEVAELCLALVLSSKNRITLDGQRAMAFYNNFFRLLIAKADFQMLLKYYRTLIPHAHTASPQFYEMLFEACDLNAAVEEVPGFWTDYISTGSLDHMTVMKMLDVSVNLSGLPVPAAENVKMKLGALAAQLWQHKFDAEEQRVYVKDPITPDMCNFIMILVARGCQWRSLQSCLKWMADQSHGPEPKTIQQIMDSCYAHDNPNVAVWVLKFCHSAFPAYRADLGLEKMASNFLKSDFLTEDLKRDIKEVYDDSTSSSESSSSESESDSDSSSDSEDLSIPKKNKTDNKATK